MAIFFRQRFQPPDTAQVNQNRTFFISVYFRLVIRFSWSFLAVLYEGNDIRKSLELDPVNSILLELPVQVRSI